MKRKKDDDPPPPKAKRNKEKAFEASDDDFQETPLLRKDKNIRTTLKAAKEDIFAPGPSNIVINEKTSILIVNKDTSVQAVSPAPTPSTSCASCSYQDVQEISRQG
ncbi:hypothetical protein RMCBS344292_07212 [Rhizopus microsporus]|nr:hypothetical protein RMCBS344292_07212 [Rhizopus microsporus]